MFGYGASRFNEYKRAVEDKNYGPLVQTSMNRCIHCTRCIRFATQIAGCEDLGKVGRGKTSEIGTYIDKFFNSELSGNVVDLCPVGALTNAPYAFTSRPWELKSFNSYDLLESIAAPIQIDTRGAEIMRILPRVHEEINEEWISDKTRHAFDGLKRQRLVMPMQRNSDGSFVDLTWEEAIQLAATKIVNVPGSQISSIIGEFADLETLVVFKDLMNRLNSENFEVRNQSSLKLDPDFRANYLMNSRITGVEEADVLLLVGTNPKHESPVLNARILKAVRDNNLKVFTIGSAFENTYKTVHLGSSTKVLEEIASGKHPFFDRLNKAKLPMVILGTGAVQRADGASIVECVKQISQKTPIINEQAGWNGFNILHQHIGQINALELGIDLRKKSSESPKVVILLGADNNLKPADFPEDSFVIYIGTSGDEGAYYADLILPSTAYTEKSATIVNTEGRVLSTKLVVPPPGMAQDDWKILRALSEEVGACLPYNSLEEVRYRLAELAPHLMKYDHIEETHFGNIAVRSNQK